MTTSNTPDGLRATHTTGTASSEIVPPLLDQSMLANLEEDLGRESLIELIGLFQTETQRRLEQIRAAIAAGDAELARRESHALKGTALTFGAQRLSNLALGMEQAGRAGDLGLLESSCHELADVLESTRVVLLASIARS